jgi:hypothetical protein
MRVNDFYQFAAYNKARRTWLMPEENNITAFYEPIVYTLRDPYNPLGLHGLLLGELRLSYLKIHVPLECTEHWAPESKPYPLFTKAPVM